jgi:hypothetical protein
LPPFIQTLCFQQFPHTTPAIASFTPAEAETHQQAWATRRGVPVETEKSINAIAGTKDPAFFTGRGGTNRCDHRDGQQRGSSDRGRECSGD